MTSKQHLRVSMICGAIILAICLWWVSGCAPRAFFNATAWTITTRSPVVVADFTGHWQAVGVYEGEPHFLCGHGPKDDWEVRPCNREGDKPIAKLWTLREAMDHFIRNNRWSTPSKKQMEYWNKRIEEMSNKGVKMEVRK